VFTAPITTAAALAPGGGALLAELTGSYPLSYAILAVLIMLAAAGAGVAGPRRAASSESPIAV
jgi:hypothetical protein